MANFDNGEAAGNNNTCLLLYNTQSLVGAALADTAANTLCAPDLGHTAWLTGRMTDNTTADEVLLAGGVAFSA